MRADANQISMKAIRSILAGAHPFELEIEGKRVACSVAPGATLAWPDIEGLSEAVDGPWPADVNVDCIWEGGRCTIIVSCDYWKTTGRYRHWLGLRGRLKGKQRELVWITVPRYLRDAEDGYSAQLRGNISTVKRKVDGDAERGRIVNDALREILRASGLPMASASSAEICKVQVPSAAVEPGSDVAFRRLVLLALLKLDFLDRGSDAAERGTPLIDVVEKLGEDAAQLGASDDADGVDADDDELDAEGDGEGLGRQYWAGGIVWGGESKRDEFVSNSYWQLGGERGAASAPAAVAWRRFDQIKVGDWLAIKGYGARNQLRVHFVGEVTVIHPAIGRVELRPLDIAQYRGPAPGGTGAGSFRDALVPVTRADVVKLLFGGAAAPALQPEAKLAALPLNLILYGPPGTGKTFRIVTSYLQHFTRASSRVPEPTKEESKDYTFITFHQAYAYEDFIEGIRPKLSKTGGEGESGVAYRLEDGVFKTAARAAVKLTGFTGTLDAFCALPAGERKTLLAGAPRYALFIDEINRGNVARVLGELITLLEPDKRLGGEHEMIVTLPYSRSRFGVPGNLHVIGTMNTADRSVEALDAALRRRFEFEEVAPDPDKIDILVEGQIDLAQLLKTMNRRIEKLFDRDHTIGHAFFEPLRDDSSLETLKRVFKASILPLLQEYFFGDWGKIGLVLGKDFVSKRPSDGGGFADFEHDDRELLEERATYELANLEQLTSASFRRIYEHVADA